MAPLNTLLTSGTVEIARVASQKPSPTPWATFYFVADYVWVWLQSAPKA